MKALRKTLVPFIALALGTGTVLQADDHKKSKDHQHPDGVISVEFEDMESYTDFGYSMNPRADNQKALAKQLREEIKRIAPRYLPKDRHLHLTFLDIDMAGDFEPNLTPPNDDVRIVRSIYAPRFLVEYSVTTPTGEVVTKGQRRIADLDFQYIINFRDDETLFYETELARQLIYDLSRSIS
ncbi:DUF3016 domain-containing protein [Actomonas aquatica]|uniref:DUF3016 domain-containing protein n=1 Tax=Actomonas aquatica TaxID=2866162 RepID=A0ABZ1C780_9BACT|nr:DUF3016 domain-containing protein [Opitutus sp. WL0086]WRQ87187.1 DUF3016 domain-containing protein [Opitutus sp. WL0086]